MITSYIGKSWANEIEKIFCDIDFPWYYVNTVTYHRSDYDDPSVYGFYHGIYSDGQIISKTHGLLMPILYEFCDKHSIEFNNLLRVRAGLLTMSGVTGHHLPHTDYGLPGGARIPHKTLLYYVNDSDGDTYFFDDNHKITTTIQPQKGKCVLFDGTILHASSSPLKNNRRIVVNYNFT